MRAAVGRGRIHSLTVVFSVAALAVTAALFWLAASAQAHTDRNLLHAQAAQAAVALENQVPTVQAQLVDAVEVAVSTGADPAAFARFVTPKLSRSGPFAAMSLWQVGHGAPRELAAVGVPSTLVADHAAQAFLAGVHPSRTLFLTGMIPGAVRRLGYAEMPPGDSAGLVVYAERLVAGSHHVRSVGDAYGNYALYLGRHQRPGALLEATHSLPLPGTTVAVQVPFGDKVMTLVEGRSSGLAGALSASTQWIILGAGVLLAVSGGAVVEYLTRRRALAERHADDSRRQYQQQRSIAVELQHALLPTVPDLDGVEVAATYLAGVAGTEVGGDWYDVVPTGDKRCAVVVGDVSGRGLRAAATMASLRFPLRAALVHGEPVDRALASMAPLLDVDRDQQFATILVAELDIADRRMSVVSAGHLLPLIVTDAGSRFLPGRPDVPIGVSRSVEPTVLSVDVPDGATVLFFSDGLVERAGEVLDVGLGRLQRAVAEPAATVSALLDRVVAELVAADAHDDTVVLGVRWA